MRAINIDQTTAERTLKVEEVPAPSAGAGEVVIAVRAAGVNRADLAQRAGKYPPPPGASAILGLEVAGEIAAVGDGVTRWKEGDRVCALLSGGGYAEFATSRESHVMPMPRDFDFLTAAALPETFLTAFTNIWLEAGVQRGQRVLVHGGSSGVGTAAIQLGCADGISVACTVGSEAKAKACRALGAALAIDYKTRDFEHDIAQWTENVGVDVVLDMVGGDYLARNVRVLAPGGRLVIISTMNGAKGELDMATLMRKRARVIGSVLRSRSVAEKGSIVEAFRERFWTRIEEQPIKPVIDSVFSISDVSAAHDRMKTSEHVGKIVLDLTR